MHAASVNPEPGSNSLKKLYIKYEAFASYLNIFSELLNSSFLFYFVMSISKFFNEIPSHFSVLSKFLCCSIFKDQIAVSAAIFQRLAVDSFIIISQSKKDVNPFLTLFSKKISIFVTFV